MFDAKDLLKGGGALAGVAATLAVGFVAGAALTRDPHALRRWAKAGAVGLMRLQITAAETREELADMWAEVQAEAVEEVEAQAMAAARAAQAARDAPIEAEATEAAAAGAAAGAARATKKRRSAPRRKATAA